MKKLTLKQTRLAKLLTFGGVGLAVTLPLAIVVACGESDAPATPVTPVTPTPTPAEVKVAAETFLKAQIQPKVSAVVATSTPTTIVWSDTTTLPKTYNEDYNAPTYSVGAFTSPELAAKDAGTWTTTLPTSVANTKTERHLWVRLVHKTDTNLSVALEITTDSKIGDIREVDLAEARNFLSITLANDIKADVPTSLSNAIKWVKPVTPLTASLALNYAGVEFAVDTTFANPDAAAADTTPNLWKSALPTETKPVTDARALWVRLKPRNTSAFKYLAFELTKSSDLEKVAVPEIYISAVSFLNSEVAAGAVVTTASTPTQVGWVATEPLPAELINFYEAPEYSSKYYADNDLALKDPLTTNWSTTLPTTLDATPTSRYLWVRLRHKRDSNLSIAKPLTRSSKIGAVEPSAGVVTIGAFLRDEVEKGAVVTTAATPSLVTWVKTASLPENLATSFDAPQYSVSTYDSPRVAIDDNTDGSWTPNLPTSVPNDGLARNLWVRIKHKNDPSLSVAENLTSLSGIRTVSAPGATDTKAKAEEYLKTVVKDGVVVVDSLNANPSSVIYKSVPTLPSELANYSLEYAMGYDLTSEDNALKAPGGIVNGLKVGAVWEATPPKALPQNVSARHFWVRLRHFTNSDFSAALEITNSSEVLNVVDGAVYLRSLASNFEFDITSLPSAVVYTKVPSALPEAYAAKYYPVEYSTTNVEGGTNNWQVDLPTSFNDAWDRRELWARLREKNSDKVIVAAVFRNSLTPLGNLYEAAGKTNYFDVIETRLTFEATPNATTNLLVKDLVVSSKALPAFSANFSRFYYPVKYSTFKFASEEEAAKDTDEAHWSTTLPKEVDLRASQRRLWARSVPIYPTSSNFKVLILNLTSKVASLAATKADYELTINRYQAALETIKFEPGSVYTQVNWSQEAFAKSLITAELGDDFDFTRFALTATPTNTEIYSSLPAAFPQEPTQRHLYALVRPRDAANTNTVARTIDLTNSSGIQTLP